MFGFSFNHSSIAEQKMVGGALNSRKRRGPMLPANAQVCVRRISASISIIDLQGKVTALAEHALLDAYTQANSPTTSIVMVNFSRLEYMNRESDHLRKRAARLGRHNLVSCARQESRLNQ
jgi:hypothetical protein